MSAQRSRRRVRTAKPAPKDHVVVTTSSYGKKLRGVKIYFEGRRPDRLNKDGRMSFGKHILETLTAKYPKFRWTLTEGTDSIETKYGIVRVKTSLKLLDRMYKEDWSRKRDIKNDIVRRFFALAYPQHFTGGETKTYVAGMLASTLDEAIIPKLSAEDRDALRTFLPAFVATESVGSVNLLKAASEIQTLRQLAAELEREIDRPHGEKFWQDFIRANILLMQHGYIQALTKLNVALGNTKYPDFALVTHDNYLDIMEIKRPDTAILAEDGGRNSFYWHLEVSKAIIQPENYIEYSTNHAHALRSYLKDTHGGLIATSVTGPPVSV